MNESRTQKSLQNAKVSLIFFLIQIPLGFFSRKIFIEYLGAEVLGLNTTLCNILEFLNLAEMGIGLAMSTTLFKPLYDKDKTRIKEILSVEGYLYRLVAYFIIIASIPIMVSFPWIFKHARLPMWYTYATYFVCVFGCISNYIWNYKEIVLSADQKQYKLTRYVQGGRFIKTIIQLLLIYYTKIGYIWWLITEFSYSIIIAVCINWQVYKDYPWLKSNIPNGKKLLHKYKDIITLTKQAFFHKISYFVLTQTAPLIIYAYASLTLVAFYGNYTMLTGYVSKLFDTMFGGMGASIGNLVAENDKTKIKKIFWELFSSRFLIASILCFLLYKLIPPFIYLWLGKKYILGNTTLLLILASAFIGITRSVVDSFKDSYKLFADIGAPMIEAFINLSCSITFGYLWGLNGILIGQLTSLFIIVLLWKPYYLYKNGFHESIHYYIISYFKHIIITACVTAIAAILIGYIPINPYKSWIDLVFYAVVISVIYICIISFTYYKLVVGAKFFFNRIYGILHSKIGSGKQ